MQPSLWKRFRQGLFTRAQFVTGVALFALASSAVIWAYDALTLNVFTSGTAISASAVNQNFAKINEAIGKLNNKFIVGLAGDLSVTGSMTVGAIFNSVIVDATGHSYAQSLVSNGSFVVQEDGLYAVTLMGHQVTSSSFYPYMDVYKPVGSTVQVFASISGMYDSSTGQPSRYSQQQYLNSGDVVRVRAYTYDSSTAGTYDLERGKTKLIFEKVD